MKLVAGLGNPGPRHAGTRHNVGFMVVDEFARQRQVEMSHYDRRFEALMGETQVGGESVRLVKPTTYMNLSGRSVAGVMRFYKLAPADVLVISDDLDLPLGVLRMRAGGSAGGQKGLADVLRQVGTEEVPRLRVGIGRSQSIDAVDFVLSRFGGDEREVLEQALARACDAVACWITEGVTAAMNRFNVRAPGDG